MLASCTLKAPCGLLPIGQPARLRNASRSRLTVAAASGKGKAKAAPPAEAPAAAAAPPPTDIPAYFQPAPVPTAEQGQVYQAVPQYTPVAPPQPQPSFWSQIPPIVYIGVGVVLAGVLNKVMGIIKGGPQKMQEYAMQQMMQQMMKQMGAPPGAAGANPFGGASPFGAAGSASPFGAAGGANPFGAGSPFGSPPASSGFPPMQPAFDTTATPAAGAASSAAAPSSSKSSSAATSAPAADTSSSAAAGESKSKKRSAFTDVNASSSSSNGSSSSTATDASASSSTASAGAMPPPPFNMPPPPFNMPPPPAGGAAGSSSTAGAGGVANTMLDMLKNPEMQKMLYPYLPEPMRNPETFEWMLSNPEYRQQLEQMLQQQTAAAGSPAMAEMMQGMDMSPEKMQAQFDALGMTPDQFIGKVMADPDLAGMMTNPKIMTAIAECTKNPMAIFNYQNDEQVMRVFEKMSQLFPQAAGAGAIPSMPPGFGMPPKQQ